MQRIVQINIGGRTIPIEEDAFDLLRDYINSLKRHFPGVEGQEIIDDIEGRIAELFALRMEAGVAAIDKADVQKVKETLGSASDLGDMGTENQGSSSYVPPQGAQYYGRGRRILRNPFDKVIGGVCSGLGAYFDVDPAILRVVMAILFFAFGVGLVAYIIAWAVIPAARTPEELYRPYVGSSYTFHDITSNVGQELNDLKKKAEEMSKDLADFFRNKR